MALRWLVVVLTALLLASACTPEETQPETTDEVEGTSQPRGKRMEGGTVVFGHQPEPSTLNPMTPQGKRVTTTMIARAVLRSAYLITPDFEYVPELLDGEAQVSGGDGDEPFTVTWTLREGLEWSDGEPISAEDLQFTYETIMDEDNEIASRTGYELITDTEVVDERTWRAEFEEPYAPYRSLFSGTDFVLPAHVLEGADFNEVWEDGIVDPEAGEGIASGPFVLDEWSQGDSLTLTRNDNYQGEPATLNRITWRWPTEFQDLIGQLRGDEIDLTRPPPRIDLVEQFRGIRGITVQTDAGAAWEQLTFNFDNELLAQDFVRQAIVLAIDRQEIVEQIIGDIDPDIGVLQNAIYLTNQPDYEPHWDQWGHDPEAAVQLLEDNGCTRGDEETGDGQTQAGSQDGEGVFSCDGEKLAFRYVGTAGNQVRERIFELVQDQLSDVGIAVEGDFVGPDEALGEKLPEGDFDIANYGWVGTPDPAGGNGLFRCEAPLNYSGYCNEEATDLLEDATGIIDEEERAAAYNKADEMIAEDVPLVPLFQLPLSLAFQDDIGAIRVNPAQVGPTWNAEDWYRTE